MIGKLFLVATPIGNLGDISYRAVETLTNVDVIACEDTRHSQILLDHYNIKGKKLISYNKDNERNSANGIIALLQSGKNVALISDAGMPIISDPGNILVNELISHNIEYTIIPGANAGLCALALSGYDPSSFAFFGFLNDKNKIRNKQLADIKSWPHACILYSSCHNINADIQTIYSAIGNREVCIVKDISKIFESVDWQNLSTANVENPKGEYVLVIKPCTETTPNQDIHDRYKNMLKNGMDKKEAMKLLASEYKMSKSEVYKLLLND